MLSLGRSSLLPVPPKSTSDQMVNFRAETAWLLVAGADDVVGDVDVDVVSVVKVVGVSDVAGDDEKLSGDVAVVAGGGVDPSDDAFGLSFASAAALDSERLCAARPPPTPPPMPAARMTTKAKTAIQKPFTDSPRILF